MLNNKFLECCYFSVKGLMKKWKAIRDAFVKDHKLVTATGTGKAASSKKRYVFYDQLLFLLPLVKGNPNTSSNIDPPITQNYNETSTENRPDSDVSEEQSAVDNDLNLPNTTTTTTKSTRVGSVAVKRKVSPKKKFESQSALAGKRAALERSVASSAKDLTNILAKSLEMQKEDRNSDQFGHKAFLLSFVPVLNNMPFPTAMQMRGQISDIFSMHFRQYDQQSRSQSSLSSAPPMTPTTIISNDGETNDNFNISDYMMM